MPIEFNLHEIIIYICFVPIKREWFIELEFGI
jgi:hypothetical protein